MVKDVLGREILPDSIVMRAKHSNLTFHRVIKFTKNSVVLSCKNVDRSYRHWRTGETLETTYRADSYLERDLDSHNGSFYFPKTMSQNGLVLAL